MSVLLLLLLACMQGASCCQTAPITAFTILYLCSLLPCRGVAELFAIEAFTLAIYTADKAGNLTQGICDSIMEQVIGGSYPRPGKIAGPRALLHPQADEMSEHGVVLYLTRK